MTDLDLYLSPVNEAARKVAAAKLGLVLEKFDLLRRARRKWCAGCGAWHDATVEVFGRASAKGDGLQSVCREFRRALNAAKRERVKHG